MSVTQKAIAGLALLLAALALAVWATAWLTSWTVAALVWGGGIALLLGAAFLVPPRTDDLAASPDPCATFEDSLARFEAEEAEWAGRLNPLCHSRLLHHGRRTDLAVVLLHGISSCPQAFVDFAPRLHARGHTVLAARMPCNGYADRATPALHDLTAVALAEFGDRSVDLARGLGERVVVCGISAGGTVAAWVGQTRADVDRAVLVAPFMGLPGLGAALNRLVTRIMLILPPVSIWKDPFRRERFEGMPHAYKRQSSRGTGEVLRLGHAVSRLAEAGPAAAREIVMVLNDNDAAIDNGIAARFAERCAGAGTKVVRYRFDRAFGLGHEIIDPMEPGADPAISYPVLLALIEGREPPDVTGRTRAA